MFGDELPGNDLKNKGIRQDLFEDQQQQLECCVEKLAMALERNFDKITPGEMAEVRLRVVSLSRLLDNCCRNMYVFIPSINYSYKIHGLCSKCCTDTHGISCLVPWSGNKVC